MKLVVGLGNPGKQYEKTRHNIGFIILNYLQEKLESPAWSLSKKFNAEISEINLNGEKIILAKPMTFMNHSGQAVGLIMHYYKIKREDLVVVQDDKDIVLGKVKTQKDRGDGGHNGIKSIIEHINTKNFSRIRVGVASENNKKMQDTAKFVLGRFGLLEKKKVKQTIDEAMNEIKNFLKF